MICSRISGRLGGLAAVVLGCSIALPAAAGERRGGVEIGSKGVKMTVVELSDRPDRPAKILQGAAANTTIVSGVVRTGKYSPDAIEETAAVAAGFVNRLRGEFGLGPDQIRVFGSSGLPAASNRQELVDAVARATGLPALELITACREVELSIVGLVPRDRWMSSALVDVGSGNTKGGFLGADGKGTCLSVDQGSVTFADRVSKEAGGRPFEEVAGGLRVSLIEAPIAKQAGATPELLDRRVVYLSGGAPYAMTTLMHPEAILRDQVEFTSADIVDYLRRLLASPRLAAPDFEAIADPKAREAAVKEFGKVRDGFTRENLIAGAQILAGVATALRLDGKTLVFDRNGTTAWLRALLDPSLQAPLVPPIKVEANEPPPGAAKPKIIETADKVESPELRKVEAPASPSGPAPSPKKGERVLPSPQRP